MFALLDYDLFKIFLIFNIKRMLNVCIARPWFIKIFLIFNIKRMLNVCIARLWFIKIFLIFNIKRMLESVLCFDHSYQFNALHVYCIMYIYTPIYLMFKLHPNFVAF